MNVRFTAHALSILLATVPMAACSDSDPASNSIHPDVCATRLIAMSIDDSQCVTNESPVDAACGVRWNLDLGLHPGSSATIQDDALVLRNTNSSETASVTIVSTAQLQGDFDVGIRFTELNAEAATYFSLTASLIASDKISPRWAARAIVGTLPTPGSSGVLVGGDSASTDSLSREGFTGAGWLRFSRRGQRITVTVAPDGLPPLQKEFVSTATPLRLALAFFGVPPGPPLSVRLGRVESIPPGIGDEFRCNTLSI
jgi:hypothetical protein